jgi:hypothetical protein|tara:strand:- start:76 stop:222 length:147 start_codon:yes stop_codon:yes gene_type:complete
MTNYQENLLERAKDMWQRGHRIHLNLFADLAREGMDVEALEAIYFKET